MKHQNKHGIKKIKKWQEVFDQDRRHVLAQPAEEEPCPRSRSDLPREHSEEGPQVPGRRGWRTRCNGGNQQDHGPEVTEVVLWMMRNLVVSMRSLEHEGRVFGSRGFHLKPRINLHLISGWKPSSWLRRKSNPTSRLRKPRLSSWRFQIWMLTKWDLYFFCN